MNLHVTPKSIILCATIPAVAILGVMGYLTYSQTTTPTSVNSALTLAQRYLDEADYDQALLQFGEVLALDPNNTQAIAGMADIYVATGEIDAAKTLLTSYDQSGDTPELLSGLTSLYESTGDTLSALQVASSLADLTDEDQWYEKTQSLLVQLLQSDHPMDSGTSHTCTVDNATLISEGNNAFGQLGVTTGLGDLTSSYTNVAAANLPSVARVYCFGNATALIDTSGNLYVAGQNYTGQSGDGGSLLGADSGFQKVDTQGVSMATVAGGAGYMLTLDTQGNLWGSGSNPFGALGDITWTNQLTPVSGMSNIISLQASSTSAMALCADGNLYAVGEISNSYIDGWSVQYRNVRSASFYDSRLAYIDTNGMLHSSYYASDWLPPTTTTDGYLPLDGTFTHIALHSEGLTVADSTGLLHTVTWSGGYSFVQTSNLQSLYTAGNGYVYVDDNGATLVTPNN